MNIHCAAQISYTINFSRASHVYTGLNSNNQRKMPLKIFDLTDSTHIKSDQEWQQKSVLIRKLLNLGLITLLSFGTLNLLVFDLHEVALIDFSAAFVTSILIWFFHRTQRLFVTLILTILLAITTLITSLHNLNHQYYALAWIVIIPPGCISMLGRQWGGAISLLFFSYILYFVLSSMDTWEATPFTMHAVSNLVAISAFILALVTYYEVSRAEMYNTLHKQYQQLEIISSTDSLTGIYNRRKIDEILDSEIQACIDHEKALAVMLIDVDQFKFVNDNFGHQIGDQVLRQIGEILQKNLSSTDSPGRWGGDEFLVVCPDTDYKQAQHKAKMIMAGTETLMASNLKVTISIGIGVHQKKEGKDELLARVDEELYKMKPPMYL